MLQTKMTHKKADDPLPHPGFQITILIYIIDLNENSKETADGHIYIILEIFENFGLRWPQIFIYMAIPLCTGSPQTSP